MIMTMMRMRMRMTMMMVMVMMLMTMMTMMLTMLELSPQVSYFILRGPPVPPLPDLDTDNDDFSVMSLWVSGERSKAGTVVKEPSVHEQEDGTILAICATGTSSRDSLLSWIRKLEDTNPNLAKMAVLFTLTSPLGPVLPVTEEIK